MKTIALAALLMASVWVFAQETPGDVRGTVVYLDAVAPSKKIPTTDGGTVVHNDLVVDGNSRGLRFVAVQIENPPAAPKGDKPARVIIDQRDMLFLPRVVAIREGTPIRFENNDLCNHAVQASSVDPANVFNVNTPPGQPFDYDFKAQKAPVMIGCPIHAWMRSWIFVFPHPYFAVTDAKGEFQIKNLPPGEYALDFRHVDTGTRLKRAVKVEAGKTATMKVEWPKVKVD